MLNIYSWTRQWKNHSFFNSIATLFTEQLFPTPRINHKPEKNTALLFENAVNEFFIPLVAMNYIQFNSTHYSWEFHVRGSYDENALNLHLMLYYSVVSREITVQVNRG